MEELMLKGSVLKGSVSLCSSPRRRAGGTVQDQILHIKQEALGEGSPSRAPQDYPLECRTPVFFLLRGASKSLSAQQTSYHH